MSRRRVDLTQRLLQDGGKMMGTAMGGLQTIESLKATGSESDFFARWSGYQAKVINSGQQISLTTMLLAQVPPFLLSVNTALLLGFGGMRVMDGHLSMGMLMAFQALMLAFVNPVNRLVSLGGTLQEVEGRHEPPGRRAARQGGPARRRSRRRRGGGRWRRAGQAERVPGAPRT